jgi:hypothetical protein
MAGRMLTAKSRYLAAQSDIAKTVLNRALHGHRQLGDRIFRDIAGWGSVFHLGQSRAVSSKNGYRVAPRKDGKEALALP